MQNQLASQESQNTAAFLQQIGAPPEQIAQFTSAAQFPVDVLYGAYGSIPGQSLSQQGAAFGTAFQNLPGIFSAQLAQNAALQQAEMAHAQRMASLSGGGGGGGGDGLTPYQAASLALRAEEIRYDRERDASRDELDWMKFQAELEEREYERQQRESQAAADALLWMAFLNPELVNDPKFMKRLMRAAGLASAGTRSSVLGGIMDREKDKAKAAQDRKKSIQQRRKDLRSTIRSSFDGLEGAAAKNKQKAIRAIMADIELQFPNFAGLGRQRVLGMVRQYVNQAWANRNVPKGGKGGTDKAKFRKDLNTAVRRYFSDYVRSNPSKPNPAGAISYITASLFDQFGRKTVVKNTKMINQLVKNYVMRNKGKLKKPSGSYAS
jgi:hypothetical protein